VPPSFADLAADYMDRHAVSKKRPKSVREVRAKLDNILLPKDVTRTGFPGEVEPPQALGAGWV
jgi:hypothetical protein